MLVNKPFAKKYYAILDKIKPDVTIEIGAYDAEFSQHMASKIDPRCVWAFEAVPNIYDEFKDSLKNINYLSLAISDRKGTVVIGELDRDKKLGIQAGASSILDRVNKINTTPVTVATSTLDHQVKKYNISGNIALWIDCEGANKEVLTGAIHTLKYVSAIYIEVELEQFWVNAWLKDETTRFLNDNGFMLVEQSSNDSQHDCIFVRKELLPLT